MNRQNPARLLAAIAALAVLAAGGCAASSAGTQASGVSASGAVPPSVLASLRATVARAEAVPAFSAPGPKVNASVLQGKSALVMPVNSQIDACSTQAQDFQQLGEQLGLRVQMFADAGEPSQWVAGITDATSAHDSALALICGIVPGAVAPQLAAAHSAGVAVVDGNYNETSDYAGLDGETAVNTAQGVTDDVDQAIVALDGKPLHALIVTSDSIVQGPAADSAAVAAVKTACPKACSVAANLDVPIQDWATATEGDVENALLEHSDINAVIVVFDGMVQFALPALTQVHRAGLQIYTWGASRSVERDMQLKPTLVAADPGPDQQWDAYEAMDQVIRLVGGQPAAPVTKEVDPDRFWTPGNVAQFFGPGGSYGNAGYGSSAFIDGFRKLWGLGA